MSLLSYNPASRWLQISVVAVVVTILIFNTAYYSHQRNLTPPIVEAAINQVPAPELQKPELNIAEILQALYTPLKVPIDAQYFTDPEGRIFDNTLRPIWTESLGKKLCIVDIDTRALDGSEQVMGPNLLDWNHVDYSGAGMMNHYVYSLIHGYSYHFIRTTPLEDRSAYWTKIEALSNTLEEHKCHMTISIDADATFMNLNLPFEWLLNRWNVTKSTSLTMAVDPNEPQNLDAAHGGINLNCGFVIAQNLPRTKEILDAWHHCPDLNATRYPGCARWKKTWPAEQAAFGEYIRYDFDGPEDIHSIPCDEANGFPGSGSACSGSLVRHHWSNKGLVRGMMSDAVMYGTIKRVHRNFREGIDDILIVDSGEDGYGMLPEQIEEVDGEEKTTEPEVEKEKEVVEESTEESQQEESKEESKEEGKDEPVHDEPKEEPVHDEPIEAPVHHEPEEEPAVEEQKEEEEAADKLEIKQLEIVKLAEPEEKEEPKEEVKKAKEPTLFPPEPWKKA
ncbi:hypothetical protein EJ08DRAFT_636550 [Tothia fuscella]|uniref:Nucleotide-diphospho-sugar transferase domain-containing protein n=1 Tax=Tothia fuscella TaxID=1048955 RepID=A0A9P4TX97_9PEZI|nr:hypothetical protein EJ08DRAFT_636550 [Tothia fuscella]